MEESREASLQLTVIERVSDIEPSQWDRLLGPCSNPFLRHGFLSALEEAGTLEVETGWIPRIPVLYRGDELVGAVPAYLKLHSFGEFVFDHAWAHFADQIGVDYYPKLLVGVPFTPVTGSRFLVAPEEPKREAVMEALCRALLELTQAFECSGVHVNFVTDEEAELLERNGYLMRHGLQYHWHRDQDQSFDDYLARFNSKRRNQLKRELRAPAEQGISIETHRGDALVGQEKLAYQLYLSTVEKFVWGRKYLNQRVFDLWTKRAADSMELVLAQRANGDVVAGAVNFSNQNRLFGRYWGCFEEVKHLHFNVCYYAGIREALERKLDVFEPGAGGDHKLVRAFAPTTMHSGHWLVHPGFREAIRRHLEMERRARAEEKEALQGAMGTKKGQAS